VKCFTFEVSKTSAEFLPEKPISPLKPADKKTVTVRLSELNYNWFISQGEIVQRGLYEEWEHKNRSESDFDKWLTKRKTGV
jgi:hypothetical protein